MKVLIIQDRLRGGGTEKHTVLLANHCLDSGIEVKVVLFRPGGHRYASLRAPAHVLQPFDTGINGFAPKLYAVAKTFAPAVVLAMGRMANHKLGRLRKVLPESCLVGSARSGRPLSRACLRGFGAADRILTNSHWMANRLQRAGLDSEKILRIPNITGFMPANLSCAERRRLRVAAGADDASIILVHVGRFRRGKGQKTLIRMLSLTDPALNCRLMLLGDGPYLSACRRFARRLGVFDRVHFAGYQSNPAPVLAIADIAACASSSESLPNFLIEAQAAGLPVVAWDYAGISETFDPGTSGLLTPYADTNALAAAIQNLAGDHDRRLAMANAAPDFVRRTFDGNRIMNEYMAALCFK